MSRTVKGFCYVTHTAMEESRAYWQQRMREALKAGGRRRVENGETFIHQRGGRLVAEVYANVPAPTQEEL
jgi:predicted P-loop ATPase/GTPase